MLLIPFIFYSIFLPSFLVNFFLVYYLSMLFEIFCFICNSGCRLCFLDARVVSLYFIEFEVVLKVKVLNLVLLRGERFLRPVGDSKPGRWLL